MLTVLGSAAFCYVLEAVAKNMIAISGASPILAVLAVLAALALYMLPAIIAFNRRHRNRIAIVVLNILLGWTFLGWVAALVWSFTADIEKN